MVKLLHHRRPLSLIFGSQYLPTNQESNGLNIRPSPSTPDNNYAAKSAIGFDKTKSPVLQELPCPSQFDLTLGQYDIKSLTPHLRYALGLDWSKTPLDAMSSSSSNLRIAFNMIMTDVHVAALFWGPKQVLSM